MTNFRFLLALAASVLPALAGAAGPVVTTPQVRAELIAHAPEGVAPGKAVWLGLSLTHQPHWHTYWKNPGDSGLPTTFDWKLPAGFVAGDIEWPTPKKLPIGPLLNYGYDGTVLLPVKLTVPAGFAGDTLPVALKADWLVCKDVCIPESGEFALDLPARAASAGHGPAFERARAAVPRDVPGAQASAALEGDRLAVRVAGLPAAWHGKALDFMPETGGVIVNAARPETAWDGAIWTARLLVDSQRSADPAEMPTVLVADGEAAGLRVAVKVTTPWPAVAAPDALPPITEAPAAAPPAPNPVSFWAALALALVGGAILNLMPCVFPVLSLKVLGFATHAQHRTRLLAGGLAYTAGVVLSFVALAALLLALRAGGEQLGWGFQLQSPMVVAGLAVLFTLIGLNLAGVFEFGSLLPSAWASAQAKHPLLDSLLTGVLAVAVASPCTAPFMGASLGAAVTLPTAQALLVFATLGLGMALPYLAASAWPGLARMLPRPGVWMAHFKAVMAFPMFATVVWLVWVLGQQAGIDGAAALLGLLVVLAFAAWAFGSPALGRNARWGFGVLALVMFGAVLSWALPNLREQPVGATKVEAGWEPWSTQRVAQLAAEGRPVFVDFTAAWCVTCQVNKRTTLNRPEVLADFERRKVARLRADWTRRDPAITAELARLGRSGVPVYALYAPGAAGPKVLSEILSVGEVRDLLAGLP